MRRLYRVKRYRIVFLVLVLFLAIGGVLPSTMPEVAYATLTPDANGNYPLSLPADIYEMTDMILGSNANASHYTGPDYSGSGNSSANFIMTNDINMNGSGPNWGSNSPSYSGTFDGGGYTISNYVVGGSNFDQSTANFGFFPSTSSATIQNVTFQNSSVTSEILDNYSNVGVVAGSMTNTTVNNVSVVNSQVVLNNDNNNRTIENAGLLAGNITGGTINNLSISGSEIKDNSDQKIINNVGVVAGSMNGTSIQNSTYSGNTINIAPAHQGTNVGDGNSLAGQATNVTVDGVSQNSGDTSSGSSGAEPEEEPAATAIPTAEPVIVPTPEPTETPKPSATPLPKGETLRQDGNEFRTLGGTKVGYAGTAEDEVKVIIPDTVEDENGIEYRVTRILKNAFKGEETLKEVTFGQYIEVVESSAFKNCTALTRMQTSPVLRIIEKEAFLNCKRLKDARLAPTIVSIGDRAFKNCQAIREIIIGDESIKAPDMELAGAEKDFVIYDDYNSEKLDTINITIGANVFSSCQNLRRVVINIQVTVIGNSAFSNCTKLTAIEVYSKVLQTVGDQALKGVHDCRISVVKVRLKKYKKLFKNRGQGKKVVVAKM